MDLIYTAGFVPGMLAGVLLALAVAALAVLAANFVDDHLSTREARTQAEAEELWSAQRERRQGGRNLSARQAHAARGSFGPIAANDLSSGSPRAQLRRGAR